MGSVTPNWLETLEERMNIDVDWLDPDFIQSMPIRPHDQTSNQLWLGIQLSHASNKDLLAATVKELNGRGWLAAYSRMAAVMCQKNMDNILGRVLVQTSPSDAYDMEKTLQHARLYVQEFERAGIPKSRYCIKILSTGPALNAAKILNDEGIPTLGTGVFSVEQAIACSQAGCLFISPYYNEVRTHENPALWPNVADPALQHPFSHRIFQMFNVYKTLYKTTGKMQPLIKNAAFRSIKEVIATAELGCHSATLSPKTIDELAATPYNKEMDFGEAMPKVANPYEGTIPLPKRLMPLLSSDPLTQGDFHPARTDIDYLPNNGAVLEEAMARDPAGSNRLRDAIAMFVRAEAASKELIEDTIRAHFSLTGSSL